MPHTELVVRKSVEIHATASRVWEIIASPGMWGRWMLAEPEVEGRQGLQLGSKVIWKDGNGKTYLTGTVSALEPNHKLVLALEDISWTRKAMPGEVTYALTLSQKNGRTHVEFVFGDLSIDAEGQEWFDAYTASRELDVIKEIAEN